MDTPSDNLKRLRKNAKLTQAQLAAMAGIPRATLANMERADANPGIQSVIAVAKALKISLDELLTPTPELRFYKVGADEIQEFRADGGRYIARMVSPIASKGVQIHSVTLLPGCKSVGRPHPLGSQEFFLVVGGNAQIRIEEDLVEVETGSLVQFPGHRRHVYENRDPFHAATAISVVVFHLGVGG